MKKQRRCRFPLQSKLILFYSMIGLIPLLVLCLYFAHTVWSTSVLQTSEIYHHSAVQVAKNLLREAEDNAQSAFDMASDEALVSYLTDDTDDDFTLYERYIDSVNDQIRRLQYRFPNLRFKIYTPNENIKFSSVFIRDGERFKEKRLAAAGADGMFRWNGVQTDFSQDYLVGLAPIHNYSTGSGEIVGILEIEIDLNDFYHYIDEATSSGTMVFLLDQNGGLILSSIQEPQLNERIVPLLDGVMENGTVHLDGVDYLCFRSDLENEHLGIRNWKNIHLVPLQVVEEGAKRTRDTGIAIACGLSLLCIVLLCVFSHHLTHRLHLLTETMQTVENGQTDIAVPASGRDEIYDLGLHFNTMLKRLNYLMNEIYEVELKKQRLQNEQKNAQLIALQSQINPHYLFNTMETIRMNLLMQGDKRTADVIRMFADSFREMIDDSSLTCLLRHELEFIRKYFLVQKYRYEEKIDLMVSVGDDCRDAIIPKFLLQPLVENAVYHGLERKQTNGRVLVLFEKVHGQLRIVVEDDGIGMSGDELAALRDCLSHPERELDGYYALRNIARRLSLLYGTLATIELDSTIDWGTRVTICIPFQEDGTIEVI